MHESKVTKSLFMMNVNSLAVLSVLALSSYLLPQSCYGEMTVYAIGVGQGDSNIIACPNGKDILIVDMGATRPIYVDKSYGTHLLKEKFGAVKKGMNIHIIISHSHIDHYSFIKSALDKELIPLVREVVLGGIYENYGKSFQKWLSTNIDNVYSVNNEQSCFGNSDCVWTPVYDARDKSAVRKMAVETKKRDPWQVCGKEVDITVLGANIGTTPNSRSVILRIVYNKWSLFLSGDFEGVTAQEQLWQNWNNATLQSTYYKISHHGAWTDFKANHPALLARIKPQRVYVSQGYPEISQFRHPNCEAIQHLQDVGSVDHINANINNPFVCWSGDTIDGHSVIKQGFGLAIYETCRKYDKRTKTQICQDIMIQTDGKRDHTQYVDIPQQFVR